MSSLVFNANAVIADSGPLQGALIVAGLTLQVAHQTLSSLQGSLGEDVIVAFPEGADLDAVVDAFVEQGIVAELVDDEEE